MIAETLVLLALQKPVRKFPPNFKHRTTGRCLDKKKKWIRGCK